MKPLAADLCALRSGGKAALARLISALETSPSDPAVLALLDAAWAAPQGLVLGLTGPPGVGKSTLTSVLIACLRGRGQSVGVIAVDPSSRRTGGAFLGDRTRIKTDPADSGVFVRSMAARRRLGGVADITFPAAVLMRAVFDWVVVETVGVGQSETEIADCADLVVFCAQPGSGDALQFMKAGVTEVPDIVLVTKGDLGPLAERAAADIEGALSLAIGEGRQPAVAIVSARSGLGVEAALELIALRADELQRADVLLLRRSEQGNDWARGRLLESFGTIGFGVLEGRLARTGSPFSALAPLLEAAEKKLHDSLKNI